MIVLIGIIQVTAFSLQKVCSQSNENLKILSSVGKQIEFDKLLESDQPIVVIFWKISDRKSYQNLEETTLAIENEFGATKVKIVGICEGELTSFQIAQAQLASLDHQISSYFDVNGKLKRQLGIQIPYTMVFDKHSRLIHQQYGYAIGNEVLICNVLRNCIHVKAGIN